MKIRAIVLSLLLPLTFNPNISSNKVEENKIDYIPKDTNLLNPHTLYIALLDSGILYPDVVHAQAILETGYLKSNVATNYNNLFGLYNSGKRDYYRFTHWRESISAYKRYIEVKYDSTTNYLTFLNNMGYAEDPKYINKVKTIMKRHKDDNYKRRSSHASS